MTPSWPLAVAVLIAVIAVALLAFWAGWEIRDARARQELAEAHDALDDLAEMYDRSLGDRLRAELTRVTDGIGEDTYDHQERGL